MSDNILQSSTTTTTAHSYNLLVVGTVRNCQKKILSEVHNLTSILKGHHTVNWLIIESDSTDDTVKSLQRLADEVPNFSFKSLGNMRRYFPERERRIAACRDYYVEYIRDQKIFEEIDYVLVADLDGMCRHLSLEAVNSCFKRSDWSACFANQPSGYYDLWALRHQTWSPTDPFQNYFQLLKTTRAAKAYKQAIIKKIAKINITRNWIEVESAFGGLGVYKKDVFSYARYSQNNEYVPNICEHVIFHDYIKKRGGKLFINPALVNVRFSRHVTFMKAKYLILMLIGDGIFQKIRRLL